MDFVYFPFTLLPGYHSLTDAQRSRYGCNKNQSHRPGNFWGGDHELGIDEIPQAARLKVIEQEVA